MTETDALLYLGRLLLLYVIGWGCGALQLSFKRFLETL